MRSVSIHAAILVSLASFAAPQAGVASALDGTYAGSYSSCSQGITGIVSSFTTDDSGKAKLIATVYNIPGKGTDIQTTMFEWTGKYDPAKLSFTLPNFAFLGESNGFSIVGIKGKYTADGKKVTWSFCGKAFTQGRLSTNPKEVP